MKKIFSGLVVLGFIIFTSTTGFSGGTAVQYKVWTGKLNINEASAAEFVQLEGIGKVTAHRIVEYRDNAGGFKSLVQMKEVKGVGNSSFKKIEPYLTLFEKSDLKVLIDLNSAPHSAIKSLPGVSKKLAQSIVEYRERNGGFKAVEDIRKISGISEVKYSELQNFVTVLPLKLAVKDIPK